MVMLVKAAAALKRGAAESSDAPTKKSARLDDEAYDMDDDQVRRSADQDRRRQANIISLFGRSSRSGGVYASLNVVKRESIAPQLFTEVPALCEPFKDPSLVVSIRARAA
jgi:hypothetical protein